MSFIDELIEILTSKYDIIALEELCNEFGLDYDKLIGEEQRAKSSQFVKLLHAEGRIHELALIFSQKGFLNVKAYSQRENSHSKSKNKNNFPENVIDSFLFLSFDGESVAYSSKLFSTWEFRLTKIFSTIWPNWTKKRVTSLSRKYESLISFQGNSESYKNLVNYHSVRLWYMNLRRLASFFFLLIVSFFFFFALLFPLFAVPYSFMSVWKDEESTLYIKYDSFEGDNDELLQIRNPSPTDEIRYTLVVSKNSLNPTISDFNGTSFNSIDFGESVVGEISPFDQHLFRIEGDYQGTVIVEIDQLYSDADLRFSILNSNMHICDSTSILSSENVIGCEGYGDGPLFISVQNPDEEPSGFGIISAYNFITYQVIVEKENIEPDSAQMLSKGNLLIAELSPGAESWFDFASLYDGSYDVYISTIDTRNNLIAILHESSPDGLNAIEYGKSGVPEDIRLQQLEDVLSTTRGRGALIAVYLGILGFDLDPMIVGRNIVNIIGILILFAVFLNIVFVYKLSDRSFGDTRLIQQMLVLRLFAK